MERGNPRQLAGVKHQLYNPRLPTLRRMDMDTTLHRLTNKHSRHITYSTASELHEIFYHACSNIVCSFGVSKRTRIGYM